MADETKTYTGVDRAAFDRLRSAITPYVTLPPGDAGSARSRGVEGSYRYDEAMKTLTLTVHKVPPFVPKSVLWNAVDQALRRR